jgi:hypothetical protein
MALVTNCLHRSLAPAMVIAVLSGGAGAAD